jgi:hypothetical protein
MVKTSVKIDNRDFWFKIVDFLQQNWALIDEQNDGKVKVFFISDASGVFDTMNFENEQDAKMGLTRNGFKRFADDIESQKFLSPPEAPYFFTSHPNGPIYSSGRFWK